MYRIGALCRLCCLLAVSAGSTVSARAADTTAIAREAFVDAWPAALAGRWTPDRNTERLLRTYPLWPDLRAAYYSARLDATPRRELLRFMARHDSLAPIGRLRYRYISRLAQREDWADFFSDYEAHYANAHIAALDCLALNGSLAGHGFADEQLAALARRLWLTGQSQHSHCDRSFDRLIDSGVISSDDVQQRLLLAIEAKQFSLARYLSRRLDDDARAMATRWQRIHDRPALVLDDRELASMNAAQIDYALRRLALVDPLAAGARWSALPGQAGLDSDAAAALSRHIAIATAQDHHPEALALLRELPASVSDQRVLEWRARAAMRVGDWPEVLRAVGLMSRDEAAADRWRYWEAIALDHNGQRDVAAQQLTALAEERSYYGFLAADRVGAAYRFAPAALDAAPEQVAALARDPALVRARELQRVGQLARAGTEWRRAIRGRDAGELAAAAALAHEWGWHAEAIAALGSIKAWDDLDIRYPLAYPEAIQRHAESARLNPAWVYGITRSESLFDREVRSPAGAWGLMQLLPSTAQRVAGQIGVRWRGIDTLKEADSNIALGTHYLASLYQRFEHRALATAAYNAGPERVLKWLPTDSQPMPADIWVETIAYDETRGYVQRVLSADIIFQWRMNADMGRLSDALTPVAAKQPAARVASRL